MMKRLSCQQSKRIHDARAASGQLDLVVDVGRTHHVAVIGQPPTALDALVVGLEDVGDRPAHTTTLGALVARGRGVDADVYSGRQGDRVCVNDWRGSICLDIDGNETQPALQRLGLRVWE